MSSLHQNYVPYDYRRLCDVCGDLKNRSQLRKLVDLWVCDDHPDERRPQTLDKINARQKPFRILPVPEAKPEKRIGPDVFYVQDSQIFNIIDQARAGGARYLQVANGHQVPLPYAADVIPVNAWACIYYYSLISPTWNVGLDNPLKPEALDRMRTAADILLALQTTSGTVATNSFRGGVMASGASFYYSEDVAIAGLAFLYAYRTLGDGKYIQAARSAASFLRNLQAIGSNGTNYTSSNSAGTARLYTGGITNFVYNSAGFYSDHRFYPSSLLALKFWTELKTTDGDQTIGLTAAVTGDFDTAPATLLSTAITDLRDFWADGTYDATRQDVRTGLSSVTPAEFFNAYPASKPNSGVTGTGSWEYQDGGASTGTTITGINFAKALHGLYAVEGASAQVVAVDNWLQTFTSNSAYETASNTSPRALARAVSGTYDPKAGIAKLLLVRDSTASYAATAKNASSFYDWGAFGLLAPLWSARRQGYFNDARDSALTIRQRLFDGIPSDGDWYDAGFWRGRQGLSYQTSFLEELEHGSGVQR